LYIPFLLVHIFCFYHTATIIFYLPILGNQNLHPALFYLPIGAFFLFRHFSPNLLASKLAAMHVLGQLSRKNLPRAMWSSAGLLEKGVDYKFHVREFMFRCG